MKMIRSQYGFSLFETLLSTGIGFVVLLIAAYLVLRQSDELNVLRDRIDVNNLQLDVQRILMDPNACLDSFKPPFAINDAQSTQPNYRVPLKKIGAVAKVGEPLNPNTTHIKIARIDTLQFARLGANAYRFDIQIYFNTTDGSAILPITIPRLRIITNASSPNTAKTVQSCRAQEQTTASPGSCRRIESIGTGVALCYPGERLLSGGGTCLSYDKSGFLQISRPTLQGERFGWQAECITETATTVRAKVYAYCCS